jgi:hypothetical protein
VVRHWDRAGARDQKPAAGSGQAAAGGANVRRRASSGEAERPGGGGRFLTASLDAYRALRGHAGAGWMYRWAYLGTFFSSKRRSKPSKNVRSERVVAYLFHNRIRQTVIPQVGQIPRIS